MSGTTHDGLAQITSVTSVLTAVFSAWCAWLSYALSRRLRNEMKSDETLIVGRLDRPRLANCAHRQCGLCCTLFNKSKRKVYVTAVKAFDRNDAPIRITWANRIDAAGNPEGPCHLLGIVDTETLFLRETSGEEIPFCRLDIYNSFSALPTRVVFDQFSETGEA